MLDIYSFIHSFTYFQQQQQQKSDLYDDDDDERMNEHDFSSRLFLQTYIFSNFVPFLSLSTTNKQNTCDDFMLQQQQQQQQE